MKRSEMADFISLTLDDMPKQHFEVTWASQDYEALRLYQKDRLSIDGGPSIQRRVMFDSTGNARYRRPYDTDDPSVGDVMHTITVPFAQVGTNYSWEEMEIKGQMSNAKKFINLMQVRRLDGLMSLSEVFEDRFWKTPTSATDDLYPYGLPYYLKPMDKDTTTDGFVGKTIRYQNGTTGTTCAGIDAASEAKWRNWAALYTDIDNTLLAKFRTAFLYTNFKAPIIVTDPASDFVAAKRVYTDMDTVVSLQSLADIRDDRHVGKELLGNIRMDDAGQVLLNRLPVVPIPQLNGATDPETGDTAGYIYCVDLRKFIPVVHENYWMEESEPIQGGVTQHTVYTVFLDGAHNNLCTNVRGAGFVLHKALTA